MKAILLAGGYGTRLRPLTDTMPKCLVPIKGQPLLDIWLEHLTDAGVTSCLVNTHYLREQVEQYVSTSKYKDTIVLVHEPQLLGTAGTVLRNRAFWENEQDIMVIHADNLCDCDLRAFIEAHHNRPKHCTMTMMTFDTTYPSQCGIVELDTKGVVQHFYEKVPNPPGNLANAAVYICSTFMLKSLQKEADFSQEVIPQNIGKIFTWKNGGVLEDIGTINIYLKWK